MVTAFVIAVFGVLSTASVFAARGGHGDHHGDGRGDDRVTICHKSGHGHHTSWQELTVREEGWDGHASHSDDFIVTDERPCPPVFGDSDWGDDGDGGECDDDDECGDDGDCPWNCSDDDGGDDTDDGEDDDDSGYGDDTDGATDDGATSTDETDTSATSTDDTDTGATSTDTVAGEQEHARGGGACMNCGSPDASTSTSASGTVATSTDTAPEEDDTEGEVLGAVCVPLLTSYLREGRANPEDEVRKLQGFLAKHLGITLAMTGVFDHKTTESVDAFQLRYASDVLAPWVSFGLRDERTPTGYVYKTTLWKINEIACPERVAPKPQLP